MGSIIKVNEYKDFGNNAIMKSDGSGNLSTQKILYPAFRANMSGNQSISAATNTKIAFDTMSSDNQSWDTNSAYSTSNYRFTVPSGQAGKYFFGGYMRCDGTGLNNVQWRYYLNGATMAFTQTISTGDSWTGMGATSYPIVFDLSVADYVEVWVYSASGSSILVKAASGDAKCSSWFGYKIGA